MVENGRKCRRKRAATVSKVWRQVRNGRGALVPGIRMVGLWLAELGFSRGDRVRIETAPGRLVISRAPRACR